MVEAWGADPAGRYDAPDYRGFARSGTVAGGVFELVLLKPGSVPGPDGRPQAPHLAVGVFARGLLKRLATRLYFPDEAAANDDDAVLGLLTPTERATLVAVPDDGCLRFDIRLQGPGQTTFFAIGGMP
jgi:protocatechuate 3,4-dioxygenase alpha subunit